jgi:hypothetical protein
MRRIAASSGLGLVLVVAAGACGGRAVAPPPATPNALGWRSCGPTDGPAETFVLGDGPLACTEQTKLSGRAHLEVELWTGASLVDTPLALRGTTGTARRCDARGTCNDLEQPTLTFRGDADGTTVGTLRWIEAGAEVVRSFRAAHCAVQVTCG